MDSDADDAREAERPERGPSLFGAVMNRSGPGQHTSNHRGRGRARSYEAPGGDNFAGGDAIDVVEATRFPSAGDNNCNMSTPSPKSRHHSQAPTTGSSGRRGGGLFGDLGGDGSSGGRFAGVASPGGYGIMDILNNMDEDSNFDKVESPSKSSKGVDNDGDGEKETVDEAPPKWKEATFVTPRWLPTATTSSSSSSISPCTTFSASASASPKSEEDEGGGGRRVQIKQESQSGGKDGSFDEGDDDVYDLPTQPPADAQNKKRKRSASDAEVVPSSNDPASAEASSDALAPKAALTVGVLDWSLKRRLRLECFPRRALPLSSSSSGHEAVDRLAARIFLHPGGGFDEMGNNDSIDYVPSAAGTSMPVEDTTTIAAAQWRAAQMYWRHPAIYPLPSQLHIGSSKGGRGIQAAGGGSFSNIGSSSARNNNPAKKALRFASSSTRTSTEDEAVAIREAADKIQQRQAASLSAMGFGSAAVAEFGEAGSTLLTLMDDPSEIIRRRQSEWTEAFRSMYYTWLERIDGLRMVGHELLSVDDVARTYFYLVSRSQTILFRCQVQHHRKDDDVEDEDDAYTIEPVIVLSSTTSGLRSELRYMGVSIFVLDDESIERPGQDQEEEGQDERTIDNLFDESVFDFKVDSSERSKVEEDEARKVREELEALRRAGAQGNAAGAEISVSVGKKKESMSQEVRGKDRDQIFRPLYVKGDDDCMAIFELLLNTRGCLFGGEDDDDGAKSDVPLLLHRSLGPTKNASIGTLSETMRLDENYNELKMLRDREVKISDAPTDDETLAKLQINGPILPCAFRDLMSASICHLLVDEAKEVEMREEEDSIANDDTVGSHYLIWYPARQEGFGADNSLTVTKSSKSSERVHMHSNKKVAKRLAMQKRETGNPTSSHFNGGDLDMDMDELSMRDGECQDDGQRRIAVGNCGSQQLLKQVIWLSSRRNALTYSTASALD